MQEDEPCPEDARSRHVEELRPVVVPQAEALLLVCELFQATDSRRKSGGSTHIQAIHELRLTIPR